MASEKDKTLHDIMGWCNDHIMKINEKIPDASSEGFLTGERFALQAVIAYCEKALNCSNWEDTEK